MRTDASDLTALNEVCAAIVTGLEPTLTADEREDWTLCSHDMMIGKLGMITLRFRNFRTIKIVTDGDLVQVRSHEGATYSMAKASVGLTTSDPNMFKVILTSIDEIIGTYSQ